MRTVFLLLLLTAMAFAVLKLGFLLWESRIDTHTFDREIAIASKKYNVDSRLIRAVIFEESRFRPSARGNAGEIGLMQVLPGGAVADYVRLHKKRPMLEVELFQPEVNIDIGTWYLGRALQVWGRYKCATELALCQYNAGQSRAAAWKPENFDVEDMTENITIDSTRRYVRNIMDRYRRYCEEETREALKEKK